MVRCIPSCFGTDSGGAVAFLVVLDRVWSGDSFERAEVDMRFSSLYLDLVVVVSALYSSVSYTGTLLGHIAVSRVCIARVLLLNC